MCGRIVKRSNVNALLMYLVSQCLTSWMLSSCVYFFLTLLKVESFILDQEDLDNPIMKTASELLLSSATDGVDLRTVDPETQARLEALLEAAGTTASSNLYWDLVDIWALIYIHLYLLAHPFWHRLKCVTFSPWGWQHTCWLNPHEPRSGCSLSIGRPVWASDWLAATDGRFKDGVLFLKDFQQNIVHKM